MILYFGLLVEIEKKKKKSLINRDIYINIIYFLQQQRKGEPQQKKFIFLKCII